MAIFRFFENLLEPTALPADTAPPSAFGAFYWHHARQIRRLIVALFAAGFVVAVLDTTIPVFFGRVVTLLSRPAALSHWALVWPQLLGMALVLLVARPMAMLLQNLITNQAIIPGFSNLIRWQSHWHVVRQSWSFFQNDFAGRIANRVMQTGPALRESVVATTNAVWYILVYGSGAIALLASDDVRLAVPVLLWFAGYAALLRFFVPRLRDRSQRHVGDTLGAHRPDRRQLHQHLDGQAVRPAARRGRLRARGDRRSRPRRIRCQTAADDRARVQSSPCSTRRWSSAPARRRDLAVERQAASPSARSRWRCR